MHGRHMHGAPDGMRLKPFAIVWFIWTLFIAGSITCFLLAMHRIAAGIKLGSRVKVLKELGDELEPEEREQILAKIKQHSLYL